MPFRSRSRSPTPSRVKVEAAIQKLVESVIGDLAQRYPDVKACEYDLCCDASIQAMLDLCQKQEHRCGNTWTQALHNVFQRQPNVLREICAYVLHVTTLICDEIAAKRRSKSILGWADNSDELLGQRDPGFRFRNSLTRPRIW